MLLYPIWFLCEFSKEYLHLIIGSSENLFELRSSERMQSTQFLSINRPSWMMRHYSAGDLRDCTIVEEKSILSSENDNNQESDDGFLVYHKNYDQLPSINIIDVENFTKKRSDSVSSSDNYIYGNDGKILRTDIGQLKYGSTINFHEEDAYRSNFKLRRSVTTPANSSNRKSFSKFNLRFSFREPLHKRNAGRLSYIFPREIHGHTSLEDKSMHYFFQVFLSFK